MKILQVITSLATGGGTNNGAVRNTIPEPAVVKHATAQYNPQRL